MHEHEQVYAIHVLGVQENDVIRIYNVCAASVRLGGKRGHADCGHAVRIRKKRQNKKIPCVSAFSTLVENVDTLENAQKMCKTSE